MATEFKKLEFVGEGASDDSLSLAVLSTYLYDKYTHYCGNKRRQTRLTVLFHVVKFCTNSSMYGDTVVITETASARLACCSDKPVEKSIAVTEATVISWPAKFIAIVVISSLVSKVEKFLISTKKKSEITWHK